MPLEISRPEVRRQSFTLRAFVAATICITCQCAVGQTTSNSAAPADPNASLTSQAPQVASSWIVRDPATGRLFRQSLVSVSVPVTRWEAKSVEQTVYEPQITNVIQQVPQTLFVPKTQYVMQPKVRGWWNPLKPPVTAYEYNPVTQWFPASQTISRTAPTQQWVPKQQKVVVYQPVQTTEVRQQLVQVELPQPTNANPSSLLPGVQPRNFATNVNQPVLRLPNFATSQQARLARTQWPYNQQVPPNQFATNQGGAASRPSTPGQQPQGQQSAPTNPGSSQLASQQPVSPQQSSMPPRWSATSPAYPNPSFEATSSGLRPVAPALASIPAILVPRFASRPYNAPLQPVTSGMTHNSRDTIQSGMQPTVLR